MLETSGTQRTEKDEVVQFLRDIDAALGNDYFEPHVRPFAVLGLTFSFIISRDEHLADALARAFRALDVDKKAHVRGVVERAIERCAAAPLGVKRSLVCIDLGHSIDPAMFSDQLWSDLLLRPMDVDERAQWIGLLVARWQKWNVKVAATPEQWREAIRDVAIQRLYECITYVHAQLARQFPDLWLELACSAIARIDQEQDALLDYGQDPDALRANIASHIPAYAETNEVDEGAHRSSLRALQGCLRPALRGMDDYERKLEHEWLAGKGLE